MKKITLLIVFAFFSLQNSAQIAPGSVAPDFVATDINGISHHLSDYLAAGKTVIMDVSATWCNPCWNYHNSKALEDIYNAYGPEGSNEVVVLFIEGDNNTTSADLNGTGTNTRGNWVQNTPYPIIDGSNIGDLYEITYFPTVFRICPNGIVSEAGANSAISLRAGINSNCGMLTGSQNNVGVLENTGSYCTSQGSPIAKFRNYGENTITSATLNLKENGNVVATKNFTGSATRFSTRTLTFDPLTINSDSNYTVEVLNVNNSQILNSDLANANMDLSVAKNATADITVKIFTDNYPTEITWNIKNSSGTIVANGGPYLGDANNGGGVDANTTKTQNVTLLANDCYSISLLDSFGDGWGYGSTPHGIEILDANNVTIYDLTVGGFGSSLVKSNALTTVEPLNVTTINKSKFSIYPNPSSGIINVVTQNPINIYIIDITGKIVFSKIDISNNTVFDLSKLQKGIYLAKIVGENFNNTEKIILY